VPTWWSGRSDAWISPYSNDCGGQRAVQHPSRHAANVAHTRPTSDAARGTATPPPLQSRQHARRRREKNAVTAQPASATCSRCHANNHAQGDARSHAGDRQHTPRRTAPRGAALYDGVVALAVATVASDARGTQSGPVRASHLPKYAADVCGSAERGDVMSRHGCAGPRSDTGH
jgi:hypothetical protein